METQSSPTQAGQLSQRQNNLQKHLRGAQEALRTFLIGGVERWHLVQQRGFLPHTSIENKFRYAKEALAHPELAARPSRLHTQAAACRAACAASPPDISGIRPRPKRARDAFGPGMLFVVNTVLAWLMFTVDVRNNMLQ